MAENIIKDFVKKQTTSITIGVPKRKPQEESAPAPRIEAAPADPVRERDEETVPVPVQTETNTTRGHVGRPKSDVEKVKLSVYVPTEAKEKLVKIQHNNYRQSLNDVLLEAVADVIRKYGV